MKNENFYSYCKRFGGYVKYQQFKSSKLTLDKVIASNKLQKETKNGKNF